MTAPINNNPNSVSRISYTDLIHEEVGKSPQEELSVSEWIRGGVSAYLDYTVSGNAFKLLLLGTAGCRCQDPPQLTEQDQDNDDYKKCSDLIDSSDEPCDCDDNNDQINPDTTWYVDADGDGYGNPDTEIKSCEAPDDGNNYVRNGDDCDDDDSANYPGNSETCDGKDNNCNETADEGVTSTYYTDADRDDYGDPATAVSACPDDATGLVDNGDDCDDSRDSVNPGQEEVCNDGLDNDCDGEVDNRTDGEICLSSVGDPSEGYATEGTRLIGEVAGDQSGYSLSARGDVNGDGKDDILVGAYTEGGSRGGASYLVYGNPPSGRDSLSLADKKIVAENNGDYLGYSLDYAGDVDGDGRSDIILGAWNESSAGTYAGAAYLFYATSLNSFSGTFSVANADAKLTGLSYYYAGVSVSSAGDVDGNGYDDLLIGAYGYGLFSGVAYVVHAETGSGPVANGALSSSDQISELWGEADNDLAGLKVATAGDNNGDGRDDVLVASPYESTVDGESGAVYLVHGLPSGIPDMSLVDSDAKLLGEGARDHAGISLSGACDVNNDGFDDTLVGAPQNDSNGLDAGAVYLLYGPLTDSIYLSGTTTLGGIKFLGGSTGSTAGSSIECRGNVNVDEGDYADLLIGAGNEYSGGTGAGAAYLLLGDSLPYSTGTVVDLEDAKLKFVGEEAGGYAGTALSFGDADNDGRDDIFIGAYGVGTQAGATYMILNTSLGL